MTGPRTGAGPGPGNDLRLQERVLSHLLNVLHFPSGKIISLSIGGGGTGSVVSLVEAFSRRRREGRMIVLPVEETDFVDLKDLVKIQQCLVERQKNLHPQPQQLDLEGTIDSDSSGKERQTSPFTLILAILARDSSIIFYEIDPMSKLLLPLSSSSSSSSVEEEEEEEREVPRRMKVVNYKGGGPVQQGEDDDQEEEDDDQEEEISLPLDY